VIGAQTTSDTLTLVEQPEDPLEALTVNVKEPDAVGVPESTPAAESVRPAGRDGDENVYGPSPPATVKEALYGTLLEADGSVVGPIEAAGATVTVTDGLFVDAQPSAPVTVNA
jgi:hypothetical protein